MKEKLSPTLNRRICNMETVVRNVHLFRYAEPEDMPAVLSVQMFSEQVTRRFTGVSVQTTGTGILKYGQCWRKRLPNTCKRGYLLCLAPPSIKRHNTKSCDGNNII